MTNKWFVVTLLLLLFARGAVANDLLLKPYILVSNVQVDMVKTLIEVKEAIADGGFELVGEYGPDQSSHVIVITNDYLRKLAEKDIGALFLAALRISFTRVGNKLQVAYTNPEYLQYAYQVKGELAVVSKQLRTLLGAQEAFGSKGISPATLSNYKYSYGMESFADFLQLGQFSSHSAALNTIEQNLSKPDSGLGRVFRIDIPGESASIFGISILRGEGSDKSITTAIDTTLLKHTARLPYVVVAQKGKVFTLHPRFKLPLDFPDLERTGEHSFTRIIKAPGAIETILRSLVERGN